MIRKLTRVVAVLLVVGILVSLGTGCVPKAPEAPTAPPPQEPAGEEGPGEEAIPPEEAPSLSGVLERHKEYPPTVARWK